MRGFNLFQKSRVVILHFTSVEFHSHARLAVERFGYEPHKPGFEWGRKRVFDDGIHATTSAKILNEKKIYHLHELCSFDCTIHRRNAVFT